MIKPGAPGLGCSAFFVKITRRHDALEHAAGRIREETMADNVDDLTVNYEEDGVLIVKEIDKVILSKGAWATVVFRYQQWDRKKEAYGEDRYVIRRYRKMNGVYQSQGKFNISSREQAAKIVDALQGWLA
jgi:hypothetical protein